MKMKLRFTESTNVENSHIIDYNKIQTKVFDWDEAVMVKNIKTGNIHNIDVKKISLFDHVLILGGIEHAMINALSKSNI